MVPNIIEVDDGYIPDTFGAVMVNVTFDDCLVPPAYFCKRVRRWDNP